MKMNKKLDCLLKNYAAIVLPVVFFIGCSFVVGGNAEDMDDSLTEAQWQVPIDEINKENPIRYDVVSVNKGKVLFNNYCQSCHGYWGEGDGIIGLILDGRPANLLQLSGKQSEGAFAWKIATGQGDMPAFRSLMSEEDIWYVVNFIASLENETGIEGKPVVVRRCAHCHGLAGKAFYDGWLDLPEMTQTEIENKLFAHRAGAISDSTMSKVTFDLSDEEIREAAAYYSSLGKENY